MFCLWLTCWLLQGPDKEPLPLTGPYTAISAYRSFTFRVDITGGPDGAQDRGELDWDCYDEENRYDEPVTGTITTNKGKRNVNVTYAVLSEAVEVNVEVDLLLPPGAASAVSPVIYGQIATRSLAFNGDERTWSVLFDSMRNGAEITYGRSGGFGSMAQIPLARSVVAMPLGSLAAGGKGERQASMMHLPAKRMPALSSSNAKTSSSPWATAPRDSQSRMAVTSK